MRTIVAASLLAATALVPGASMGQTPQPGQTPAAAASGGPANICAELVTYLQPKPEPAHPAATAPGAQAGSQAAQPAGGQSAGTRSSGSGPNPTGSVPAAPTGTADSAQQASGQAGAAPEAPKPGSAPATGAGQNAPQTSGQSAPIPAPTTAKKQPSMSLEEAEALASANDIAGCRTAAQKMRREGVAMPPALIALAAMDLKYLTAAEAPAAPAAQPAPTP